MFRPPPRPTLFPYTTLFRSFDHRRRFLGEGAGSRHQVLIRGHLLGTARSEEHTSELQSRRELVCRLLLEKKKLLPALIDRQPCPLRLDRWLARLMSDATPAH